MSVVTNGMNKKVTIEKLENSQIQMKFEIAWEDLVVLKDKAITSFAKDVKIDGFREGKAPADVVEKHVGEPAVLEEMASQAINVVFPEALQEEKIDAIGQPFIQITKLAKENTLEFSAVVSVIPNIKLGDYKKIAKKHAKDIKAEDVADKDVESAIEDIKQMYAKRKLFEKMQNMTEEEKKAEAEKAKVENNKDESQEEVQKRLDEKLEIPELTDEFVKEVGPFENVADFKEKVKENLKLESERKSVEEFRMKSIEEIVENSELEVPQLLVGMEVEKMISRMKQDVERMGMTFEDYLKNLKKTEDDLKKDVEGDAKKRAAAQLVINQIAKEEKIVPNEEKVKTEIEAIKKAYPDVGEAHARGYIENILINEEVLKFLEGEK